MFIGVARQCLRHNIHVSIVIHNNYIAHDSRHSIHVSIVILYNYIAHDSKTDKSSVLSKNLVTVHA